MGRRMDCRGDERDGGDMLRVWAVWAVWAVCVVCRDSIKTSAVGHANREKI